MKDNSMETNGYVIVTRIDEILSQRGENRNILAKILKISPTAISHWYTRGTVPAADVMYRIADYLGVDARYLVYGEYEKVDILRQKLDALWGMLPDERRKDLVDMADVWARPAMGKGISAGA